MNVEKKLAYIVESLLSEHIKDDYPEWKNLIQVFSEYLDLNTHNRIINILDNLNYNTIYSELLDDFTDNYFKDVIDSSKYQLTDDNKRLFLSMSKILTGTKGVRISYDILFKYLTNFVLDGGEGVPISVDEISVGYEDNEKWWKLETYENFYDGTVKYDGNEVYNFGDDNNTYSGDPNYYDGSITYSRQVASPYTYKFSSSQSINTISSLIESLHPAGFQYLFERSFGISDSLKVNDDLCLITTYRQVHDGTFLYDNVLGYTPISIESNCEKINAPLVSYDDTWTYNGINFHNQFDFTTTQHFFMDGNTSFFEDFTVMEFN